MFQEKVHQVMTRDVVSIDSSSLLSDALSLMAEKGISFLVISSGDGRPAGVITESDVLRFISQQVNGRASVGDLMTSPVLTAGTDENVLSALHQLVTHNIKHLVVVDIDGRTAGVLTLTNFLEHLGFEYFVDIKEVSTIMTRNFVTIPREAKALDAIRSMDKAGTGCTIVVESGRDKRPVGIFTQRDAVRIKSKGLDLKKTGVSEVMNRILYSIKEGTSVLEAAGIMIKRKVRNLPVIDVKDRVAGLVSQFDITRGMELKYAEFLKMLITEQEKHLREANEMLEEKVKERTKKLLDANRHLHDEMVVRKRVEEELRRSKEELRSLASRMRSIREEERRRMARDIHDDLGQLLTVFKFDLSWIGKRLNKDQKELMDKINGSSILVDRTIERVQKISSELRPTILDNLGIKAAMEWQADEFQEKTGIMCHMTFEPKEMSLDNDLSTEIFRIFQEALTNVARHAGADMVDTCLGMDEKKLVLTVTDNGKGITRKEMSDSNSLGLIGIRERVHPWDGTVDIEGKRGKGTRITVTVPLSKRRGKR